MQNFKDLLADLPGINKRADIVQADQQQLESDFGQLAYAFFMDRAHKLAPYLIGFEVVEREEDGSKAVGIFGAKVGKHFYYIPVFFINNQIRGMDSIYSRATNMFMPLQEEWLNYLINKGATPLGESANKDDREDFESPRFDFLAEPPDHAAKVASALDFAVEAAHAWNEMQTKVAESIQSDTNMQDAWAGFIGVYTHQFDALEKKADGSMLLDYITDRGGVDAVNRLMSTLASNYKYANAAMHFYPSVESLFVHKFNKSAAVEKQAKKVTITTQVTDYKDGKETKRLVRDGFVIKDLREEGEKSEVLGEDYSSRFANPDCPGKYNILYSNKSVMPCRVFDMVDDDTDFVVVTDDSDRNCFRSDASCLFSMVEDTEDKKEDCSDMFDDCKSLDSVEVGKSYLFVDDKMRALGPYTINSVVAENGKRLRFNIHRNYSSSDYRDRNLERQYKGSPGSAGLCVPCSCTSSLEIAEGYGCKVKNDGDKLIISDKWKAFEVEKGSKDSSYEVEDAKRSALKPGNISDVMLLMQKEANVYPLSVYCDDGSEYCFRFNERQDGMRPVGYKQAMCTLVGRYGTSVDDAEDILKEAKDQFKAHRLIKLAQIGVAMPAPPSQSYSQDPYGLGMPMVRPEEDLIDGQTLSSYEAPDTSEPGFNLYEQPDGQIPSEAVELAEQAAATGQRRVFDSASIDGLAKIHDIGHIIDSYIPSMLDSLDKIGRVLFLFYWKNKEFNERYGINDIGGLEDTLKGTYNNYGDLILQLRQKAIDHDTAEREVI